MATTNQFLYQYRWGVAAVGAVAVVLGGLWIANRPAVVEPVPGTAAVEATAEAEAEVAAMTEAEPVAEVAPVTLESVVEEPGTAEPESPAEVVQAIEVPEAVGDTAEAVVEPVVEAVEMAVSSPESADAVDPLAPSPEPTELAAEVVPDETAADAGPTVDAATPEPAPEIAVAAVEPESSVTPTAQAPTLDLVRVEPGGSAVIAGRAEPNSEVEIIVDGDVVATTTATESGEFVAFVETTSEPGTQAIQAATEIDGGVDLVSADTVLVLTPEAPEGEIAAPAVVSATADAITVLQPGGLAIPDQVSLDSISYDQAGEAILAGRAQPLSELRIYVDDVFAVSGTAAESGAWQIRLDQVAAGRYILRVDEIGPDGAVTSRAQTPFQKEYPENIAPFLQMANGKLTVQPGNTLWVMAREIYGSGIQYTQIFAANKDSIGDPNLIFPGQIFDIPEKAAVPE